jgi:hypothetical protein
MIFNILNVFAWSIVFAIIGTCLIATGLMLYAAWLDIGWNLFLYIAIAFAFVWLYITNQ